MAEEDKAIAFSDDDGRIRLLFIYFLGREEITEAFDLQQRSKKNFYFPK